MHLILKGYSDGVEEIRQEDKDNIKHTAQITKLGTKSGHGVDNLDKSANTLLKLISHIYQSSSNSLQCAEQLHNNVNNISTILNLIKDISDQTNLLALNAAIEAAKAWSRFCSCCKWGTKTS